MISEPNYTRAAQMWKTIVLKAESMKNIACFERQRLETYKMML